MSQSIIIPEPYIMLAEYNQWMNQRLYALIATIPDELRRRDLGAYFKSIHGTLSHILYGDLAWMERLALGQYTPKKIDQHRFDDFEELQAERVKVDIWILAWAQTLTAEQLAADFTYISNVDGGTRIRPTWALVSHLFNHQTHHRGQLTTILHQQGYDVGVTDIPWLPRWE
ncbi:DinB family protein [Aquirhabdus sp.]|uniref:DinB family protein n=1 Tax=Aquirhabdus sp. TaxID=2824160 RepID=UPI00396CE34D